MKDSSFLLISKSAIIPDPNQETKAREFFLHALDTINPNQLFIFCQGVPHDGQWRVIGIVFAKLLFITVVEDKFSNPILASKNGTILSCDMFYWSRLFESECLHVVMTARFTLENWWLCAIRQSDFDGWKNHTMHPFELQWLHVNVVEIIT